MLNTITPNNNKQTTTKRWSRSHSEASKQSISEKMLAKEQHHQSSASYSFTSPCGVKLTGSNVCLMIRQNTHLFESEDVVYDLKTPRRSYYCKAYSGLMAVKNKKAPAWKGWKLTV